MAQKIFGDTKKMTREEWLESRRRGVGGSDVGIIMGVNPYKTIYELWKEKIEGKEYTSSEAAYWGNILEETVAQEFKKRTGKKVAKVNYMLQHKDHEFMLANIDRRVVGESSILECKTTNEYNKKLWKDDEVPASYIFQCMHYLAVTGAEKAYIACLIGGQKYVYKEIARNEELIDIMIQRETEFWECVKNKIPPAESKASELYIKDNGEKIQIDLMNELLLWDKIIDQEKELKAEKEECKESIQEKMKDSQIATFGERKVTWKSQTTNRINTKKLKEEKPEIYAAYLMETNSRVFKIK